ncbi:MAG: DNA recombination protein RmuC [Planctomycetes bacterium]|nr:DNA recombination protein RmuC [Planctomycetota bacterium]
MLTVLVIIVIALVLCLLVLVGLLVKNNLAAREEMVRQSTAVGLLQQQLEAIRQSQTSHGEALTKNLQTGQQSLTQHLEKSHETLNKLHTQIGQLQGAGDRMLQLGADVRSLQDILKAPKLRGQLGEQSLERLLGEVLPAGSFRMQHAFTSGKIVDALVKMPDYSVPVDAKFPLPSFERMINSETDDERARQRRTFLSDVKKRIDEIAAGYINPTEGTLDFALMYIPAENVYYETVIKYAQDKTDILKYALDKKVIPVSPNLLYAYLMTIVMGLHGLQIEKQAAQIRENLKKIGAGFETFTANWDVLGKHLRNAQNQYDEGQSKLNKFTIQLDQIQTGGESDE